MKGLFDMTDANSHAPLAERMRPVNLDEITGQDHLLGEGKVLRGLIEQDAVRSAIFWGPPGVGKTTIASVIARMTGAHFLSLSAVAVGVKEVRRFIEEAKGNYTAQGKRTILFLDEIHRFNKAQQDALLPSVEQGTIILIGATTENPSFEVNAALLSRSRVFVLKELSHDALDDLLSRALSDSQRGLGALNLILSTDVRAKLIGHANGDARSLLNILELAALLAQHEEKSEITLEILAEALQQKSLRYDRTGDEHHNVISAFIKSMRNSDSTAALYWLARMIDAGEDPLFIARRMIVFASEDIGVAQPTALVVANAVAHAVHFIGMPEARINLAHGVAYLAECKKSNQAYAALNKAMEDVKKYGNLPVPLHLRNAVTGFMKDLDYGKGYKYAHDFAESITDMQCLPHELKDRNYFDKD